MSMFRINRNICYLSLIFFFVAGLRFSKAEDFGYHTSLDTTNFIDRKIEQQVIVPNRQWIVGMNTSYNHIKADNFNLIAIDKVNVEGYSLKVSPFVLYTFKDNMSAGAMFSYERSLSKINNIDISIDDENKLNIKDLFRLEHTYTGTALFRQFLNIGDLKRFAFFSDLQISLSGGQAKVVNGKGENMTGIYEKSFSAGVGISPGIVAFITDKTAVEVSVGLLGVDYSVLDQTTNKTQKSRRTSSKGNFLINLFSIGLGISWYI